jgi:hypothetical protein
LPFTREAIVDTEQRIERLEVFADDVKTRLTRIEEQLKYTATKEDVANLRADISALEVRMVKWFIFASFGMTTVMGSVAVAAIRFMH